MKVLLVGEYSGFYLNLKQGLQELGVDVTLAANGDGWKQIPGADMSLYFTGKASVPIKIYRKLVKPILETERFHGYDVVQLVNENIFRPYINSYMIRDMKRHNGKLYVNVAGNSYSLYKAWKDGKLGYYTYDNNPEKYDVFVNGGLRRRMMRSTEEYVDDIADGIVPIMYEYAVGVRERINCKKTIQLPFNADKVEYKENKIGSKLVIFHGILREKDKGTDYIRQAFEIIKQKYPNDVEIVIEGRLPLKEYLEVLKRTNILVDQCKEHCWGLNACYGMAQGKVVLGGASNNSLREFGLKKSPVFHIMPNVEQIVGQLSYIIENRNKITEWGYESRKFVETFHNHISVAQKYVDMWQEYPL